MGAEYEKWPIAEMSLPHKKWQEKIISKGNEFCSFAERTLKEMHLYH